MADKVAFELVTPERLVTAGEVEMVVVPGGEGDFGVLPGHSPILSTLRPGIVDIHDDGGVRERIFVSTGFAEANEERCTVLTDEAVSLNEIDQAAAAERLTAAETALAAADEEAKPAAEAELVIAEAFAAAGDASGVGD